MAALSPPILLHETAVQLGHSMGILECPLNVTHIARISSEYFLSPVYLDF